jgi:glycosyltransferase involved in cell wall biosynthesis
MPKISVVIPAYNAEIYLSESIESILNQSFSDFELVIIDDCSVDNSWEIINKYALQDSRVKIHRNQRNLGIAGNRNKGIELSCGDYLAWQDADDISIPTRLERQVSFLETHKDVGIVGGYLEIFRESKVLGERRYPLDDLSLRRCIFRYSPIAQPAAMIRMEALNRVGAYDLSLPPAEDLDMTFRIGELYKLANLDLVLVRYRESVTSATATSLKKMEKATIRIRKKNFNSKAYKLTTFDIFYNLGHFLSLWIFPTKLKIRVFNLLRNKRP